MDKVISTLRQISDSMEELGNTMRKEEQVYKAELADRLVKGLSGDAAIKHYNDWMIKAGMNYLKVHES
ncbi:MAG: hypothetical protein LKE54_10380 [Prevotella sp.]|jgi:hypothetical protein|nr:hypothetical protein [Prevotella sp.]MCH3995426.1 hypothetical protein [Prevotella sp.]